jgi:hypothetical protein
MVCGEDALRMTQFVGRFSESLSAAKQALQVAQQRQNAYADKHRSPWSFSIGGQVLLSSRKLKQKKAPTGARMPRWLGQLPVMDKIGAVTYKLELPTSMHIHPVFHVSLSKPFHRDSEREQPPPPPVMVDGE